MDHAQTLSRRGWNNVEGIMPRIQAAVQEREKLHQESNDAKATQHDSTAQEIGGDGVGNMPSVIDLSTAEDWTMRDEIFQITKEGIASSFSHEQFSYPGGFAGDPGLLDALAAFFNSYFHPFQPVVSDHLVVAPGAAGCLDTLLYNICDPGDGILIPAPYWSAFDFTLKARSSVEIVPVQVDDPQQIMSDALIGSLERTITATNTPIKALLMCNPQNPLAQCYPAQTLIRCLQFCQARNIHYISDEIYALTSFPCPDVPHPPPFVSVLSLDLHAIGVDPAKVHAVWSTSKDFGQNGLRLGALVTQSNTYVRTGAALAANTTISSLTAVAGMSLLRHPKLQDLLARRSERLAKSYATIAKVLKKHRLPYIPAYAGLYVFVCIAPTARDWVDEEQAVLILKQHGISVAPGKNYHMPDSSKGWARISFSIPPEMLEESMRRLDAAFLQVLGT